MEIRDVVRGLLEVRRDCRNVRREIRKAHKTTVLASRVEAKGALIAPKNLDTRLTARHGQMARLMALSSEARREDGHWAVWIPAGVAVPPNCRVLRLTGEGQLMPDFRFK